MQELGSSRLSVLVVVDVIGALAAGSLLDNSYMVDNNHYLGSWREGSEELHTVCEDGQAIVWSVASLSSGTHISIAGFSGPMTEQGVCSPRQLPDGSWIGKVESQGTFASFPYTLTFAIEQTNLAANCFIKVA